MEPIIDISKEYGIVLEGGGAKGAYQIGAWRALKEAGIKIAAVSGTSVGALNGALICMDDLDNAEDIWKNISYSQIMDVDDEKMKQLFAGSLSLAEFIVLGSAHMNAGGMDVTPLRELIAHYIDEGKVKKSPINFYFLTFSMSDFKELDLDAKELDDDQLQQFLLASACIFPLFKNEKLNGKMYIDGGAINNLPLDSLVSRGYKDIIMIRIFGIGRQKRVKIPEDTTIYSIEPRVPLGNIIDFDPKKSVRNMKIGYYDAKRFLYGLAGNIYYIEENNEECYYLNQLINLNENIYEYLMEAYHFPVDRAQFQRKLLEQILPAIAIELKLKSGWNYRELYIAMLEATAKICRVRKYAIYTVESLLEAARKHQKALKDQVNIPVFVFIILNAK